MDRQYIRDNQVIERYLQGRLTADEESAFEEAYIGDPDLFQELKTADLLRRGLELHETDSSREQRPSSAARGAAVARGAAAPRYALAASLVAAVGLAASAYLLAENAALRSEGVAVASGGRVIPLLAVRGGEPNRVEAAATNDWTVLLLDPFIPYDRYGATLVRRGGSELLAVDGLTPSYESQLAVVVPSRLLTPGDYDVILTGRMRDWPEQRASDDLGRTQFTVTAAP
jgi:hypothetical protein